MWTVFREIQWIKGMIENGSIGIVGGSQDISTGVVTFYPETLIVSSQFRNE